MIRTVGVSLQCSECRENKGFGLLCAINIGQTSTDRHKLFLKTEMGTECSLAVANFFKVHKDFSRNTFRLIYSADV